MTEQEQDRRMPVFWAVVLLAVIGGVVYVAAKEATGGRGGTSVPAADETTGAQEESAAEPTRFGERKLLDEVVGMDETMQLVREFVGDGSGVTVARYPIVEVGDRGWNVPDDASAEVVEAPPERLFRMIRSGASPRLWELKKSVIIWWPPESPVDSRLEKHSLLVWITGRSTAAMWYRQDETK